MSRPPLYLEKLADELIELQCGTHSLGLIYQFLLKTYGDPRPARADFVKYLSGELPDRLLEAADLWVAEEQEFECVTAGDMLHPHSGHLPMRVNLSMCVNLPL